VKRSNRFLRDCEALIIPGEGAEFLPRHFIGKFDLHQRAYALFDFSPRLEVRYLYYFLHHVADYFPRVAVGATVKSLRLRHFQDLPVRLAHPEEQRRIVAILDEAFEAIATAKANTDKNLQNAQRLQALGRDRTFLAIGGSFQRRGLGDVCGFVRGPFGGSLKKEVFVPSGFAVYEQGHAIYDQFDEVRYFIDEAKFKAMQRFELRPGDLIMSCSGTIGKVAIAPTTLRPGIINQALLKLTPGPELRASYLKHWMESSDFQDQLRPLSGGAAIQNVASVAVLKGISLPLPTLNAQDEAVTLMARQAEAIEKLSEVCKAKLDALDELKKSLLHQAFTGQLTAKSTDRQLEAVA
jgi:type I restriction enzyme S subunit